MARGSGRKGWPEGVAGWGHWRGLPEGVAGGGCRRKLPEGVAGGGGRRGHLSELFLQFCIEMINLAILDSYFY